MFLGNTRFLFLKQSCNLIDISKALGVIDKRILNSKNLNFSSSDIILEFSENPTNEGFLNSSVNIGRLITGFEQQVFDELSFKDNTVRGINSTAMAFSDSWNLFFEKAQVIIPKSVKVWTVNVSEDFSSLTIDYLDAAH